MGQRIVVLHAVIYPVLFLAAALACSASHAQTAAEPAPTADYDVLVYKTRSGPPLYGLVCDNGSLDCNYIWARLCKDGLARNADPFGELIEAPGYSRDPKGRPMRLFVCR